MASSLSPSPSSLDQTLRDVDDYVLENGSEGLSRDTLHYVYELVKNGNVAFRENRMEEAINFYSRANNIKSGDPIILSNRSAAYIRISQYFMHRTPSSSERRPLSGLEPTTLAELGLKDAEKLVELQSNSAKSYLLKANAFLLENSPTLGLYLLDGELLSEGQLEKYEKARDVILSGLQVDPFSNSLRASLQNLESVSSSSRGMSTHGHPERNDDFDCTLCLKLLYEPVTTPCGHSFCCSCLFQSMDRGNKCPLCRTVLFISPRTCSISVTLKNIIQKNFPEEYAERKQEHDSLIKAGVDLLPLFVMDVVIPCQRFPLNIFEPRYRLMVRRIMEGNHRMGMAILDSTGSLAEFACEVEITECEPLPDGRFYIEIESRRRFRIIHSWDQDGYRVAEVEWIQDIMPPEGTSERDTLQQQTYNAVEDARSWIARAKEAARHDQRKLERLASVEVMMPSPKDPERFSFWLATLSNRRPAERLDLLRIRDTAERIRRGLIFLRQEEQGCRIQ
ncbi:LON peptidase N-terminal domain and RING finger protein 3 [Glycine soja]|uniref:RING-type domain-containing protein n=1 Tax=Glycine max TaxID=3847 RepID=A0A0R0KFS1_SOYBN|nr:LON peptidase N-terminal domain and RING finger protein 1 isoform X2 [Glycine max]XP_028229056.1 LON peptidase N-terminal domain and RING finger protein 1-like isoform X2 [Glycine soja]KAH1254657.1 LON peptidase N-terminal domain and RING finger protein 3 [Glycine max]|eukprot:XP_014630228.1 LON peptidase N-terminal domain and RING finger protein 1 isoform X2 [Glycine max]